MHRLIVFGFFYNKGLPSVVTIAQHNDDINYVTLKNVPENLKLASPSIQKDI